MSQLIIAGDTSGTVTLQAPAVAGTTTLTLPASNGTVVLDTSTQILTNKTLTSPVLNTPTINSAPVYVNGSAPVYLPRAWVAFDAVTVGSFAGGASTVTRIVGSTTATVTCASPHNLTTNNSVYAATGVAAAMYLVTVLDANRFTITTVATTALSAVSITFPVCTILGSGNVNSVIKAGTGRYYVNLITPLEDAYGVVVGAATSTTSGINPNPLTLGQDGNLGAAYVPTNAMFTLSSNSCGAGGNSVNDLNRNYASIIR